jgi:hypothetical protein
MDQTTLSAAAGTLPWRSQDHKTNPSSSSIELAMPTSLGPDSGSDYGMFFEQSLKVGEWMIRAECNLSTEDRFAAVTPSPTLIFLNQAMFLGSFSSLPAMTAEIVTLNPMHESRDAVPCAATSLLPSQEHWRT